MSFSSPLVARERILLYGEPSVGKSHTVVSLAQFLQSIDPSICIYVIDNDRSYQMAKELLHLDNMVVAQVYSFPEHRAALDAALAILKPNDWLICDLASEVWPTVQSYYTEMIYDDEVNYFLKLRAAMSNPAKENVLDGWTDWQYINKAYNAFIKPFVYQSPCHVIATSTAEPVARPKSGSTVGDDKETVSVFGGVGFRPEGQKRLRHQFNTTIFLSKDGRGEYRMTTVKDRNRELIVGQPIHNFAMDYLKGVAGWQLTA